LSNSNKTITTNAAGNGTAQVIIKSTNTGKYYFETKIDALPTGGFDWIGEM
jgi:hypothetical protein